MQYTMKQEDVQGLVSFLNIPSKMAGDDMMLQYCPYCGAGSTKKEDYYKYGINVKTGACGGFRESCTHKTHFVKLCRDFGYKLPFFSEQQYKLIKQPRGRIKPADSAIAYLENRGISREVAERYEITALEKRPNIMVFPFFNEYGKIDLVKYRDMAFKKGKNKKGNKEWCEKDCRHILFGMKQCEDFGTLVITEGQIDSLSVAQAGIKNAVSVPTGANGFSNWLPNCYDWISKFDTVIVFGDYEKGHMSLLDELLQKLPNKIKAVRSEDYMGEKDANDILRAFGEEAVRDCINNAVEPGIDYVIELADVRRKNDDDEQKIRTGITEFDEILKGGLRRGQLLLLTGKSGQGKSTLASQILAEALDQDQIKVFAYSGELDNEEFQECIDWQIAGDSNMAQKKTEFGNYDYYLDDATEQRIKDWYRGKMFIYDNNRISVKDRPKLLDIVKHVIIRKGVQLVLIDNLMTAMEFVRNQNDLHLAQTNFVAELKEIAQQYHVVIILIAHPRKQGTDKDGEKDLTNDDVAGSSNIVNLADVVASYYRAGNDKDYDSVLQITKNRKTGKLRQGKDAIQLLYSQKSKRVFGMRSLEKHYGWEKGTEQPVEIDVPF